jgi:hypothetical protein
MNVDNIIILENIFPSWFQNSIESAFETMPWKYTKIKSMLDPSIEEDYFTKVLYMPNDGVFSDHLNLTAYVNDALTRDIIPNTIPDGRIVSFDRCRANATLKGYELYPHVDSNQGLKHWSLVYYVNDSDGDTIFYDDKLNEVKRSPYKKGNAVLFPAEYWHKADITTFPVRLSLGMVYGIETKLND